MQLAALALPAHPGALRLVVEPAAMQDIETRRAFRGITGIEPGDLVARILQDLDVGGVDLGLGIRPVGQQREMDFFGRVGEVMHLDVADVFLDIIARADQRRHHDQGA
ncbi:hypothetical protein X770_25480 [Mesorhizobium sp. LSJC269B00]|uniref:hypothetical protein n=1 Tax=Mesorhizobium sp. LSJC269B00 TaxID=1287326 RepID=UPI0003CEF4FE|nr:hypothetical protein [Mesorhizobium sp. LSJC269B00]ESW83947.1 hypothetical protein X770_25480 [Mesorhizobium sp. LSJC269B00]ESX47925.1 hypothetical protein X761_28880 [Mesorhizobium sp. LSHC424B00]